MKKIVQGEYFLIILLIAINLVIGVSTLTQYGESWDEDDMYQYADQSANAYRAIYAPGISLDSGKDVLRFYGPAYVMGMSLLVKTVHRVFTQVQEIDLWHIGNFATLQLGLLCFYLLLRRFIAVLPSLVTSILFVTQPIIWGHGFINPKDIPFMTFFTASVYFGLRMTDSFRNHSFDIRSLIKDPWYYASVVSLGLTISIRILGFAAAGIVLTYLAFVNIRKVLRLSYAYVGSALFVTFLTWPYLWPSPIANFIKGIYAMLKFQWVGRVLFNGVYYPTDQLPRLYVPQLLIMQLTETALLSFAIGVVVCLSTQRRQEYRNMLILFGAWCMAPLLYILLNGMNLYDNTRQLFFILPGFFLICAIGMDMIFHTIHPNWAKTLLLILAVLPGVTGIVKYHPYEYTYYNFATTAIQPIFRHFETDYWATSFKDVSLFLNENAPQDSQVIVWGPGQLIRRYVRKDIQVSRFDDLIDNSYASHPYYLVLTTRYDMDQKFFPENDPIYSVQHNGSVLAVVKYITPQK